MELQDAIRGAGEADEWLRPVAWRGSGMALCVQDGRLCTVPGPRGAEAWCGPGVEDLVGEWDVVSPGEVCEEREKWA